jgi:hypothetical protein
MLCNTAIRHSKNKEVHLFKNMKWKIKNNLVSIPVNSLNKQREHLYNFHQPYKENLGKVDDICVMGVRV